MSQLFISVAKRDAPQSVIPVPAPLSRYCPVMTCLGCGHPKRVSEQEQIEHFYI